MSALRGARGVAVALTGVLARAQATRGRLLFALGIGALLVLAALALNVGSAPADSVALMVRDAGFGFVIPVVTLLFAVACLGDLVEDRTLVYVWLRPVPRWELAGSATAATLVAVLPVVAVIVVATSVLGAEPGLVGPALAAGGLAVAAYGALFVALGLRTTRSLLWGLLYILLWEGLAAGVSSSFARLALRRYTVSVYAGLGDVDGYRYDTGALHGVVVLLAVAAAGVALCTWLLRRQDVP